VVSHAYTTAAAVPASRFRSGLVCLGPLSGPLGAAGGLICSGRWLETATNGTDTEICSQELVIPMTRSRHHVAATPPLAVGVAQIPQIGSAVAGRPVRLRP
jgi:hypothetical protein